MFSFLFWWAIVIFVSWRLGKWSVQVDLNPWGIAGAVILNGLVVWFLTSWLFDLGIINAWPLNLLTPNE